MATKQDALGANNLFELCAVLRDPSWSDDLVDIMDNLPTFGGTQPVDTHGVWSWDSINMIVGTCSDDFEVVAREG